MTLTARRHEALYAMAHADESPRERDRARDILDAAGVGWKEPPRRPPAAPAPSFYTDPTGTTTASWSGGPTVFTATFTIHVRG